MIMGSDLGIGVILVWAYTNRYGPHKVMMPFQALLDTFNVESKRGFRIIRGHSDILLSIGTPTKREPWI